jgi:hypothetical protein
MKTAMQVAKGFDHSHRRRAESLVLIAHKEGVAMAAALLEGLYEEHAALDDGQLVQLTREWIKEMREIDDDKS